LTLDNELALTVPALLSLFDVPVEDPQWQSCNLPAREQTMDAVKHLLLREIRSSRCACLRGPALIDSETQAFSIA